jgi:hypothetical protein
VDDEGVELSGLDNSGGGGRLQVLLLIFASLGVLVVDDQVNFVGGTALVGTEHDNVRGDVRELILVESLVITEELQVSTTTLETICRTISESLELKESSVLTLKLDFVLDNECLSLVLNLLGELGRDGMMSCSILDNKAFVALHALVYMRLLYSPLSNVCPFLILVRTLCVLLGVRRLPSCLPIVCELLEEVGLELGRLRRKKLARQCAIELRHSWCAGALTVKVGSSGREDVAEVASLTALDTEELASLRTDCASALTVPANKAAAEMAAVVGKRMATQLQRIDQRDQMY